MTRSYLKPLTCVDCSAEFIGGSTAKRCPACSKIRHHRQQLDSQNRRNRGKGRALGSTSKCLDCGTEYIVSHGLQRYCAACGKKRETERGRASRYTTEDGKRKHVELSAAWAARNRERVRATGRKYYHRRKKAAD